ncbi:MAG: VOC family protein, partial [Candidatus Binatia bacterium]
EPAIRVGVPYDDMGAAVRFLTGVLGMHVLKMWGPEDSPMFAYLAHRDSVMSIAVRPPRDNPWSTVGPVSVGLTEPDEEALTQTYQRAVEAGCEILRELGTHQNPAVPDGYLGFVLRDFEGNLWSMESRTWTTGAER